MEDQPGQLFALSRKAEKTIVGLMSGTSLDGLDVALCRFSSSGPATRVQLMEFTTMPYPADLANSLAEICFSPSADLRALARLNVRLGRFFGESVNQCLQQWKVVPEQVDLVASHGQTVFHTPSDQPEDPAFPHATLQIGDGDQIACITGRITLSDFRQKALAAGTEGAPLAPIGDFLLFSHPSEHRLLLNIGGIANFTFLPAGKDPNQVAWTDTGPGNTLLDQYVRQIHPGKKYDEDGRMARKGTISEYLLSALLDHPFFRKPLPRSTGQETFHTGWVRQAQTQSNTRDLNPADLLATLTELTARTIAQSIRDLTPGMGDLRILVSGGGLHNSFLLERIEVNLGGKKLEKFDALGIIADAKEAVLFAVLANECISPGVQKLGNLPALRLGKISLPR